MSYRCLCPPCKFAHFFVWLANHPPSKKSGKFARLFARPTNLQIYILHYFFLCSGHSSLFHLLIVGITHMIRLLQSHKKTKRMKIVAVISVFYLLYMIDMTVAMRFIVFLSAKFLISLKSFIIVISSFFVIVS